ncbi:MAG: hypothetical protein JJT76_14940 [Clostridiaceae bacterium]|nr:hypothetical protein [Clostridiaceae bacterium]
MLSSCTQSNEQSTIRIIEDSLGKKIDKEEVTLISYPQQDIGVYQNNSKVHFYIFENKNLITSGVFRENDILDRHYIENNYIFWNYNEDTEESLYILWGAFPNTERGCILLNEEPIHPNYIELEKVTLFYQFFEHPLKLPIYLEQKITN